MKILSYYTSFPSTVALYSDGKIVASTHEERFTRQKNDEVFPEKSAQYCLDHAGITAHDLDAVALAGYLGASYADTVTRKSGWSVNDYITEQYKRWLPISQGNKTASLSPDKIFPEKVDFSVFPGDHLKQLESSSDPDTIIHKLRSTIVAESLGLSSDLVHNIEHHRCHAAYSYYASPFRGEKVLALTIDGSGDGLNATAGIFDENGIYSRFYKTSECNIGRIYRYCTLLLGMKPNEHEFKVMGLAPYGKYKYAKQAYDLFKSTLYVDGIEFKWNQKPTDSYFWFKDRLEGVRFDNIAFALQAWVEDLLTTWVKNCISHSGISKVVISGGVSMNIKAMGKIANLPCVDNIFVGGSSSDESNAIGAALCLAEDLSGNSDSKWIPENVNPISNLYLGPEPHEKGVSDVVLRAEQSKYNIIKSPSDNTIVELLIEGKILARCIGRMEFGQRSLGNRSIIADPSQLLIKEKINKAIKNRDFWMPFAPIVLDTFVDKYLVNPKKLISPYMTLGFDTTDEGYSAMLAACHPADRSARPQILTEIDNPPLYQLIKAFSLISGRGAILNTSFNLHGYPIVNTAEDAYHVFINSELDGLILPDYLILKT